MRYARLLEDRTGENNPMYEKIHSEKTRLKISEKAKGRLTSEDVRKKIFLKLTGENHPFFGKVVSEEKKRLMSNPNKIIIEITEIESNDIILYNSICEAAKVISVSSGAISISIYLNKGSNKPFKNKYFLFKKKKNIIIVVF